MIRLHHAHGTRSQRVLWLLHELGVAFDVVDWPFDKTLRSDAYASLHPVGRVPALEIDGEVMMESGAMIEYLCERFPDAGLGRGPRDPDRIDWLQWVHFAETISQHIAALTQQHLMIYPDESKSAVVMKLEAKRLARCIAHIDAQLSTPVENREHLLTSGFSAADIAVGQAVAMARHFVRLAPYPNVLTWLDRITARPAFALSRPPEGAGLYQRDFYPAPED